ncbi:MAG: hypothetical protein EB150_03820 [Nitrososphaeria archaeon]|nr:hypothetical protein [Nitrososphaeria archaeon]NDB51823.1 hypothetical protein [Nitrosopumilaceae archaeon]NDB88829.1 hypothetical protein [Nitrososphaerota archaeon]NDB46343.1 hypothetical protein [Nitrososphaeria archaeon]NDB63601.1 hypothetical protein [Nitrosopumilaceae archaeon]
MTCKGICSRYKAQKPVGTGRYASGQRRCQICEIFIKWEGLWCPCCGYRLRTKPRNLKYKAKLRARVEAEAQEATGINSIETVEETVEVEQPIVVEAKPARKRVAKAKTAKAEKTAKTVKATRKPRATKASKVSVETAPEEAIAIKA